MPRKKSRSELLNEELDPFAAAPDDAFDEPAPAVDDYDANEDAVARPKARKSGGRLLRRGPLDASLQSGKYAAVARAPKHAEEDDVDDFGADDAFDERDANANVDSIFGMFDEDDEAEAGLQDEDAFEEYMEAKARDRKRRAKRARPAKGADEAEEDDGVDFAELDDDDADVMRQIHELRQRQKLAVTGSATEAAVRGSAANTAAERERAQHCVSEYSALLALRLKMQPLVARALRMPQHYSMPAFARRNEDIAASLSEARKASFKFSKCTAELAGVDVTGVKSSAALWDRLSAWHAETMQQIDTDINVFGHRAQVQTDTKLKSVNRPLLEQIQAVIANKQRLLHRAQRNRGHVHIYGHPHHFGKTPADRAAAIADGDTDRQVFDDIDFVRELVGKHGGINTQLQELMKDSSAKAASKKGHHRLTKGRSVNYDPRAKLVGFMVPLPYEEGDRIDALRASLFGRALRGENGADE